MTHFNIHNDTIGIVTLTDPPGNKLNVPDFIDLNDLTDFVVSNKIKALIIKGAGRHFSSGADINQLRHLVRDKTLYSRLTKGKEVLQYIYDLNIPVISAIEGVCFGGGLEIALSTHIRVASEKALLAFPESNIDLMPGLAGSYAIKKHLSLGHSIELMLSGNIISTQRAIKLGLCDYSVPAKTSCAFACELAGKLSHGKSIRVINNIMIALKNSYIMNKNEALKEETRLFCELAKCLN